MPRFVLLRHECPPRWEKPSHWDFMLEVDNVLWTWELRALPAAWAQALGCETASEADSVPATRLADHRVAYLDYEGPVTGGRGHVTRMDRGTFQWVQNVRDRLEVKLEGGLLRGVVTLDDEAGWILTV